MVSSFNTMYDISKSLKLIKDHPLLLMGTTYHITESNSNAKIIKVGLGITQLYIRDEYGENYLLEGNANKIKELFQVNMLFENIEGDIYKLKRPIGSLHQNVLMKEISAITADEQIYVGGGVTERYFIENNNNKVIKFIGNSTQIKYLFEKVEPLVEHKITPVKIIEKPVVRLVEKKILREISPQIGPQGEMGPTGIIGTRGEKGDTGEKGEKGDQGDKGDQGEIGPVGEIGPPGIQGIQGIQGPPGQDGSVGPQGDVGPQGFAGPQGIQGKPGSNGQNGKDGIQGAIGPQGPMGEKGDRGEKGEKGDRGQNGLQGIPGVAGTVGQKGDKGDKGDIGPVGISPVITAEYPVILKEGKISFDAQKLTSLLDQFKNQDIQKAIDSFAKTATPGGGGLGILFLGSRVLKSVNDINFTGSGVTVIQRGKGVEVNISGITGSVNLKTLAGLTSSISGNTTSFSVNYLRGGGTFTSVKNPDSNDVLLLQQSLLGGAGMYTSTIKGLGFVSSGVSTKVTTLSTEYIKLFTEVDATTVTEKSISYSNLQILLAGNTGATGNNGATGATGSQGIQGNTGNTGGIGPQGNTGIAGSGVAGNNDVGVAYLKNNAVATVISVVNERAVVAGGLTTGTCFNFQKHSTTNSLQYLGAGGRFHVVASFNFWTESANDVCGFYIGCNRNISSGLSGDADRISESEVYVESRNSSRPVTGTIQTVLDLNTDDRLFFIVQNRDDTHDITVQFLKFVAVTLTSERGATGATGADSTVPGPTGPQGNTGATGPQGNTGADGVVNYAFVIAMATVL